MCFTFVDSVSCKERSLFGTSELRTPCQLMSTNVSETPATSNFRSSVSQGGKWVGSSWPGLLYPHSFVRIITPAYPPFYQCSSLLPLRWWQYFTHKQWYPPTKLLGVTTANGCKHTYSTFKNLEFQKDCSRRPTATNATSASWKWFQARSPSRKRAPIIFVTPVRPSVRMYKSGCHCANFSYICYCGGGLWKSVDKFQIWLKSDTLHVDRGASYFYTLHQFVQHTAAFLASDA